MAVALVGLYDALTPLGKPDAVNTTAPENPFTGLTVIMLVALPGCEIVMVDGDDASAYPGAVTVRLMVVVLLRLPEIPVTASG